jgi:predicted TPR repeat methyltransferase
MNNYVYTHVEKYCKNGSILDLGCGSGNTGNEIDAEKYCEYTGVDISSIAINKATIRSELNHRGEKNRYFQAELSSYTPQQKYDVILFRESIYYIRRSRIKEMLDRYLGYLKEEGVFIVSFFTTCNTKYRKIVDLIVSNYEIVEKNAPYGADAIVIVFRQKQKI